MKGKLSFSDLFSNKSFDQLFLAYKQLQEENRLLRENGIQQATELGQEIKQLTYALESIQKESAADIDNKLSQIASAQQSLKTKEDVLKEAEAEFKLAIQYLENKMKHI